MRTRHSSRAGGFTIVEMVMAIIIVAIVSAGVAVFIRLPVSGYVDSVARADVTDAGDTALRRIARDVRLAVPNSIRISPDGTTLEMLLTRTGGRYLDVQDYPTSGNVLDFTGTSLKFDVVGAMPSGVQAIQVGDSVVVANQVPGSGANDAYVATSGAGNRAAIASLSGNTITLSSNPFSTVSGSPYYRFQVMSGPVTYRCDTTAQTLTRYWNYTITASQPTTTGLLTSGSGAANALMANGVSKCLFSYTSLNAFSALAELDLVLIAPSMDNGIGGSVGLFQQIHVDNTP